MLENAGGKLEKAIGASIAGFHPAAREAAVRIDGRFGTCQRDQRTGGCKRAVRLFSSDAFSFAVRGDAG